MIRWIQPQRELTEQDVNSGLRFLLYDGMCSQVLGVLTGGAFLIAFALLLGASNKVIGLLAAVGPFAQVLQIPAIFLVERIRMRKLMVVLTAVLSRLCWVIMACLPWFFPSAVQIPLLVASLFLYFGISAVTSCAFNSWMRDFVPEERFGRFFGKRMAIATAVGSALSLAAGVGVDLYRTHFGSEVGAYSILFIVGTGFGLTGAFFLGRIPEPRMGPTSDQSVLTMLSAPFRNANFRQLLYFLGAWSFAVNLAAPFFVVYMLRRLGLSMTYVLILAVVSQLTNVVFFRIWGGLADRFSNKSVIGVAGFQFIITFLIWPFTTMPESHFLTIPLLVVIHVLTGVSTAGVNLCAGNIALKSAPRGSATAYLATNALVAGCAATIGPILAGVLADIFVSYELSLDLTWISTAAETTRLELPALNLRGLDFLFVLAFIFGLYALHRLLAVTEEGEAEEDVVSAEFYREVRKAVRHVSNVAGLRQLTYFPYEKLKEVVTLKRKGPG